MPSRFTFVNAEVMVVLTFRAFAMLAQAAVLSRNAGKLIPWTSKAVTVVLCASAAASFVTASSLCQISLNSRYPRRSPIIWFISSDREMNKGNDIRFNYTA